MRLLFPLPGLPLGLLYQLDQREYFRLLRLAEDLPPLSFGQFDTQKLLNRKILVPAIYDFGTGKPAIFPAAIQKIDQMAELTASDLEIVLRRYSFRFLHINYLKTKMII